MADARGHRTPDIRISQVGCTANGHVDERIEAPLAKGLIRIKRDKTCCLDRPTGRKSSSSLGLAVRLSFPGIISRGNVIPAYKFTKASSNSTKALRILAPRGRETLQVGYRSLRINATHASSEQQLAL
ncbi:hypothetical protein K0M31_017367 [Melipona bicolor]|uniref:Uncharacterized protein n=1 Tax=Melipona bicolor TaxID=60889 RepID=A0AA40KSD3_9HYME|nr:hypothetical protein K0M31_017367 [Melipona bicolor]